MSASMETACVPINTGYLTDQVIVRAQLLKVIEKFAAQLLHRVVKVR